MSVKARATRYILLAMVGVSLSLGACTTTTITPEVVTAPPQSYDTIVIREIEATDELVETRLPYFRAGLVGGLREADAFPNIVESDTDPVPMSGISLTGRITEVDKGSKALRFIIGFGAGRAKAAGSFELHDAEANLLAKFESRKAYSGGAGIGGFDFLDMDELLEELGQETAGVVIRWSKGEPLHPPSQ
jgi:hypothetical protein